MKLTFSPISVSYIPSICTSTILVNGDSYLYFIDEEFYTHSFKVSYTLASRM